MIIEIIVAALIITTAVVVFVKNIKKQASGHCNCGCNNCSSNCSLPKTKQ